jgi:hypothetical protein
MQAAQRVCVRVVCTITTIVRMMECRPEKLYKLDHRYWTVLHAAAGSCRESLEQECRADICLLVRVCPAALVKTPLHLACDGSYSFVVGRDDSSTIETEVTTKPQSSRPSIEVKCGPYQRFALDECFRICHFVRSSDAGGSIAADCRC